MNLFNVFKKHNASIVENSPHQCCKCVNCEYYKNSNSQPVQAIPVELTYEQKKTQLATEKQIAKELEEAEWDKALEKMRIKLGLENFESLNLFQRFERCLQFHKLCDDDIDNEISMYILMKLISSIFLDSLSKLCGLIKISAMAGLVVNTMIFAWNISHQTMLPFIPGLSGAWIFIAVWIAVFSQIFYGLFKAARVGVDKSKNKNFISMVFGFVIVIIIAIATIGATMMASLS